MFSYLREENRCYLMVTTLVSLGVAYFVNKLFSTVYPKKKEIKQIDLDDNETCKDDLKERNEITDIKEALKLTESLSEDLKLYSKSDNLYKMLDLLVDRPEQTITSFNKSELDKQTQPSKNSTLEDILPSETLRRIVSSEEILVSENETKVSSEAPMPEHDIYDSKIDHSPSDIVQTSRLNNLPSEMDPTNEFDESSLKVDSIIKNDNLPSEEVLKSNIDNLSLGVDPSFKLNSLQTEEVSSTYIETLSSEVDPELILNNLPTEEISTSIDILPSEVNSSGELHNLQSEQVSTSKPQVLPLDVDPTSAHEILSSDKLLAYEVELIASKTLPIRGEMFPLLSPTSESSTVSKTSKTELEVMSSAPCHSEGEMLSSETQTSNHETADIRMLSINNALEEFDNEVTAVQSKSNETMVPSLSNASKPLLQESKIESVSFKSNEILEISPQNSRNCKNEVNIISSIEKEIILSNGEAENEDSYIKLKNSDTVKFPLDTIPLEMIYQILPLSMR